MDLVVRDLTVARGGVAVLSGVSFVLSPGQALILRGPNGSGKTTLLRTIAGLQPAISGDVSGAEERSAYAGHADGVKATLTVAENLTFWASVFGQSGIEEAVGAFDLLELRERPAGRLSAGQRRRLGLARLMVTAAPVWLLDEPTVSLDAPSVDLFARAVKGHLSRGGMALMATHIDLGLEAETLNVSAFLAAPEAVLGTSDEAFL